MFYLLGTNYQYFRVSNMKEETIESIPKEYRNHRSNKVFDSYIRKIQFVSEKRQRNSEIMTLIIHTMYSNLLNSISIIFDVLIRMFILSIITRKKIKMYFSTKKFIEIQSGIFDNLV